MIKNNQQGAALLLVVIVLLSFMLTISLARYRAQWYQVKQMKQHIMVSQHRWHARGAAECAISEVFRRSSGIINRCQGVTAAEISIDKHDVLWSIHSQSGQQQVWSDVVWLSGEPHRLAGSYYEP